MTLPKCLSDFFSCIVKYRASILIVVVIAVLLSGFIHAAMFEEYRDFYKDIALPVGTAIGAIIAIVWGFKQLEVQGADLSIQREALARQNKIALKEIATELYKNAIEHLGSGNPTRALGDVYSLNDLARSYEDEPDGKDR
ncbi:MAG: hypothetical protein FWE95_04000 [Planctomycetaceae bacterium]|nr:hypothetical protein [Planctomycetaceae bacterium]